MNNHNNNNKYRSKQLKKMCLNYFADTVEDKELGPQISNNLSQAMQKNLKRFTRDQKHPKFVVFWTFLE